MQVFISLIEDVISLEYMIFAILFAVDVLTNWYKSGKNVQDLLPKLSIYLGHLNVSFTSVYLTKTPTLLQEANKLFYAYKNTNNEEQKNY